MRIKDIDEMREEAMRERKEEMELRATDTENKDEK